jgi:hypothetical protein
MILSGNTRAAVVLSALLLFLTSCDSEIEGLEIANDEKTSVSFLDLSLPGKNIYLDSLRTDDEEQLIVGELSDQDFGASRATGFMEYVFTSGSFISDSLQYDSLIFTTRIRSIRGSGNNLRLFVHRISENIYREAVYVRQKTATYSNRIVDTVNLDLNQGIDSVLTISLPNHGQTLYNEMNGVTDLRDFSATFALVPDDNSDLLISLDLADDTSSVVLYTSKDSLVYTSNYATDNVAHFSNISRDHSASNFSSLQDLDTFDINGGMLLDPLLGYYPVVDMQPFIDFVTENDQILINKAEIEVELADNSGSSIEGIRFFFFKEGIGIEGDAQFVGSPLNSILMANESYLPQSPTIVRIAGLQENQYRADVTLFTEVFYNNLRTNDLILAEKMVLIPNEPLTISTSFMNPELRLKLYYTTINQ